MAWCDNCLRCDGYNCEAFKQAFEGCFAKETDKNKYIKEQYDIIKYNSDRCSAKGVAAAKASIRRVKVAAI